jgi:glutaredoxin 3
VKKDAKQLDDMLKLTGGRRVVPVIVEDGKARIGYGGS